jgi:LssY-like putative type I secretion system component LssY
MRKFRLASLALGLTMVLVTVGVSQEPIPEHNDDQQQPAVPTEARKLAFEVDVPAASQWTDTGIAVVPGDQLTITASGKIQNSLAQVAGPEGFARDWRDLLRSLPVNGVGGGALIGRIGDATAAVPFAVGASKQLNVIAGGRLFLGVNQLAGEQSGGSFHVSVTIVPAGKPVTSAPAPELALPADLLARIPRRVADVNGKPGDLVNFIVIGSEEKLKAAFQDAGWVKVDRSKSEAILHALLSSTAKASYVEMPMSELYLFGRAQDFGFARAEPIQVVTTRHHLRVWRVPFDYQGQAVWAGAATHDIGFEKDQRTGGVTHKIDPNVDQEREFLGQCFQEAGALSGTSYLTPSDMVREAHTATGGSIKSDGRVLAMVLRP